VNSSGELENAGEPKRSVLVSVGGQVSKENQVRQFIAKGGEEEEEERETGVDSSEKPKGESRGGHVMRAVGAPCQTLCDVARKFANCDIVATRLRATRHNVKASPRLSLRLLAPFARTRRIIIAAVPGLSGGKFQFLAAIIDGALERLFL
jgi:hypothetical protein